MTSPGESAGMRQPGKGGAEVVGPAQTRPLVLVLDSDVDYRERLAEELEAEGVKVEITAKGNEGLRKAIAHQPELVMIGMSGDPEPRDLELLPRIWQATAAPVLILQDDPASGRGLEDTARAGAVACLSKAEVLPRAAAGFAVAQLAALGRTTSRFRRSGAALLDIRGRTLRVGARQVPLTRMQADILGVLLEPPADEWKSIPVIAHRVFGEGAREGVVRKHINRLRVRFARAGLDARIDTAHTKGYRVVTTEQMSARGGAG